MHAHKFTSTDVALAYVLSLAAARHFLLDSSLNISHIAIVTQATCLRLLVATNSQPKAFCADCVGREAATLTLYFPAFSCLLFDCLDGEFAPVCVPPLGWPCLTIWSYG